MQVKQSIIHTNNTGISNEVWSYLQSIIILPLFVAAIFFWRHFYSSQLFKLAVSFVLASLAFGLIYLIPQFPMASHSILFLVSLLILSLAEIYISPIIHSILTQYANQKYLAIMVSLSFLPTKIFTAMLTYMHIIY